MKIETKDLQGSALDWAVAKAEAVNVNISKTGFVVYLDGTCTGPTGAVYNPSVNWILSGPIIERELLQVSPHFESSSDENEWKGAWCWKAYVLGPNNLDDNHEQSGRTPLIAAMRCYVSIKLGNSVNVPDNLV